MIVSIINGHKIESRKVHDIFDVNNKLMGSVYFFDEPLDSYVSDLLPISLEWRNTEIEERKSFLYELKKALENEDVASLLVETLTREIGKPLVEAETEISESTDLIDFFIENVNQSIFVQPVSVDSFWVSKINSVNLQPVGIVGIIKPWNYPITNSLWSIIPALLAGNVVIYKPSEYASRTASLLCNAIFKTCLPKGVFNVIYGDQFAGEQISKCKAISMISFTGGSETAKSILLQSAEAGIIRKYSIESGGSDFAIVDEVVDMSFAVEGIVWGAFNNSGQVCTSIENILVPQNLKQEFLNALHERVQRLTKGVDYGCIQNSKLMEKVASYLRSVRENDNNKILCGGEIIEGYLQPTVIECDSLESASFEVFSNIVRVFSYRDFSDVAKLVNSSRYGLGCTIWTSEPHSPRINKLISDLDVGMVWINDVNIAFPQMPWTGIKDSGTGFNLSLESIREFSTLKAISIDSNSTNTKEWWYPYDK